MSSNKCARCNQTVYPVEVLRCLDQIWHKGCFKCHECNMTLNMTTYKGFEKRPYCNAHCPQAKATTVADTPEARRLAENTRIQSQVKYHEDFEKSKGKGFTAIADDPETLRIKNTSKIISNVAYHGELERKKQMEEKRGFAGVDDINNHINNNSSKQNNRMQHVTPLQSLEPNQKVYPPQNQYQIQSQQQLQKQQQQQQQHKHHVQPQQQLHKPQQQPHKSHYAQDNHGGQQIINHGQYLDNQAQAKHSQQQQSLQNPINHPHHNPQQQVAMRQQQQQRQQIMMMMQQQQYHRQSMDSHLMLNCQVAKQSSNNSNNHHHPQHLMKLPHNMIPAEQQMKFIPHLNDGVSHQASPTHLIANPQMINPSQVAAMPAGQRMVSTAGHQPIGGPPGQHHMMHGHNHHQLSQMNGAINAKVQAQQQFIPQSHMLHPSQMQAINQQPLRPHSQHIPVPHQQQQQLPRRVFRAMYDYVANDVDEVSFFENDILIDCVNVGGDWLVGKVARSGQTGMLPANYVSEFSSH